MTSLFLSEANKLKNIQLYLEKNNTVLNNFSRFKCKVDLLDYSVDLEKYRTSECDQIIYELKNIWQLLITSREFLQEKSTYTADLNVFKKGLVELQDQIYDVKSKLFSTMESLKDKEKSLLDPVDFYNQKLREWEESSKLSAPSRFPKTNSNVNYSKEVKDYFDFLARSKGHENGWSKEDHQLFLKLRSKYKNIADLSIKMNSLLPDISVDDVKKHELWFRQYLNLNLKKKMAIEQWRRTKSEIATVPNADNDDKNLTDKIIRCSKYDQREDKEIREKIALWKAEKEAKRQQDNFEEQQRKEKLKQIEEDKRRANTETKQFIKKWKEEKMIKQECEKIKKELAEYQEKRMREIEANKMIKQFQSRDDIFIAKIISTKRKEMNHNSKRTKSSYLALRDPERIFKPTKQWTLRTAKLDFMNDKIYLHVPNIRAIPKLGIPEWRKMVQKSNENFF